MPRLKARRPPTPRSSTNATHATPPVKTPRYRTVAQLARELGIGPVTLKKLVRNEPWVRIIGSRTFVEVAAFQAWFDAQRPQPRK
jgi:hypothetical protein